MPIALPTLPAVSPTGFSVRFLWVLADFWYCSSRFTVRVSFLPHSDICPSSENDVTSARVYFFLYMVPLEDIIARHGLHSVIYAEDTQLYKACDSRADFSVVARIDECIDEIRRWMRGNMLALNEGRNHLVLVPLQGCRSSGSRDRCTD